MSTLRLELQGITKQYPAVRANDAVNLRVKPGQIHAVLGENGAGKSTLFKLLLNLIGASGGLALVRGLDPAANGPLVRAGIGYVPERTDLGLPWLTVRQALDHHAAFHPTWDAAYAARLSALLELRMDVRSGKLSKGQSRRVQLVMALAHRPPLLLLDEPTDGLDPVARDEVLGLLAGHVAETGCTLLISTHVIAEVDRLADHIAVLSRGRLLAQTTCDALARNLRLYRADVPEGWNSPDRLPGTVLRKGGFGREIHWTVWGDEWTVAGALATAGALVRDVAPLRLDEAVVTLLRAKDLA